MLDMNQATLAKSNTAPSCSNTNLPKNMGSWQIHVSKNRLTYLGQSYAVEPRQMQVLWYLYLHADSVVSIEELIEHVWDGKCVGNHAIYRVINQIRKVLSQDRSKDDWIITIPRRGYQLNFNKDLALNAESCETNFAGQSQVTTDSKKKVDQKTTRHKLIIYVAMLLSLVGSTTTFFVQFSADKDRQLAETPSQRAKKGPILNKPALEFLGEKYFDTKKKKLLISNSDAINLGNSDFSISVWLKTQDSFGTIVDKRDMNHPVIGYLLMVYEGRLLFQMGASFSGWHNYYEKKSPLIADNYWHHVSVTVNRFFDKPLVTLYVDGKIVTKLANAPQIGSLNNSADLLIGAHQEDDRFLLKGSLMRLMIYKNHLSNKEIYDEFSRNVDKESFNSEYIVLKNE